MKTRKILFTLGGIMAVMLSVILFAVFTPVMAGVYLATGTAVASPVSQNEVVGGDGYDEAHEYIDMRDVQRKVEEYRPYQTPILTLMSNNKKETCESWEKKYFAIDSRGLATTVVSASTITANTSTLTLVDSSFFTKNNTAYFAIGGAKITHGRTLQGLVVGIPEAGKINVVFTNNAAGLVAADLSGCAVQRGGSAMAPKAASTGSWAQMPEPDYNYVQLFMEQVEIEDFQEKMKKQIDWNIADMKRGAIEDFKIGLERTFLNGVRSTKEILIDGQVQKIWFCGGILQDTGVPVTDNVDLLHLDEKTLNAHCKLIFTGNNGSKNRFLLGGADYIEALENITADMKYIMAKETNSVLGMEFVKIVSMFGTINVAYYEQLDLLGRPKDALVIDKPNITMADLEPFNIRDLDLKSSGIAKVTSAVIEQTSTMLVKNKTTHRIFCGV